MEQELHKIEQQLSRLCHGHFRRIFLYPGIQLCYFTANTDSFTVHHPRYAHMMEINYCHSGRLGWKMESGHEIYLGPGDFSIHTLDLCADSIVQFPSGTYDGLTLYIDLQILSETPPEPLSGTEHLAEIFREKFWQNEDIASFAGNAQTDTIFSAFYEQPEQLQMAFQKIKCIEILLYLCKMDPGRNERLTKYQSEQVEIIRQVHEYLTLHIGERITIEELSRRYLINPTTLKSVFKSVYGNSLAAHINEHRMEHAAKLLIQTDLSIAEIGQQVGYESQSKFTSAFKRCYQMLPKEYRKKHRA